MTYKPHGEEQTTKIVSYSPENTVLEKLRDIRLAAWWLTDVFQWPLEVKQQKKKSHFTIKVISTDHNT